MWLQDRNGELFNLEKYSTFKEYNGDRVLAHGDNTGGGHIIDASMEDIIQAIRTKAAVTSLC